MTEPTERVIGGLLGCALVLLAGGAVALLGSDVLESPVTVAQITLLLVAGAVDVVAARDTRLTDRWAWYRWSGLGDVLLGVAMPLGVLETGAETPLLLALLSVGGLAIGALGADLLVFHGKFTRDREFASERA